MPPFGTEPSSYLSSDDGRQHLWHEHLSSHNEHPLQWQLGSLQEALEVWSHMHTHTYHHILMYILSLLHKLSCPRHIVLCPCAWFYKLKDGIVTKMKRS